MVCGMADARLPVERLRQFLREIKPGARALLIAELERSVLRGGDMPGAELVLQELRRSVREAGRQSQRIGNLARMFFQPLEPFLVDDTADHKHCGRIARVSLEPIWEWISRDLVPGEAKAASEDIGRALIDNDAGKAEQAARNFQVRAIERMQMALDAAVNDDKAQRRLSVQVGTPRALDDVRAILGALKARDVLEALAAQLPGHIKNLADVQLAQVKALLDTPAYARRDVFLYALVLVMSRLAARWQLIRLAVKAAGSDIAARVAETPYAVAVTIVLAETGRMVAELRNDLRSGRGIAVGALLKDIHDAARGLRTELDLPVESPWGQRLAHLRADISNLLKDEIESMPGRVRRLLRQRPAKEIAHGATLDQGDVAETESLIEFVGACRNYAGELAISEMTQRAYSELEQYLDAATRNLLDALRGATDADRNFRRSQLDAAIRFCAKVFGQQYASLLSKAAEVALTSERKAAKA
jgi:hypothetical protein